MQKFSSAATAIILAIGLYFTLIWGYDALRILTSPNYGLEEVWRSDYIFAVGRLVGLGPIGLLKLAAFFGAVKLVAAAACGWHIVDRVRCLFVGGKANADLLEGALILVVGLNILSAGLAARSGNAEIVRDYAIQLILACLATALCLAERSKATAAPVLDTDVTETETRAFPSSALHP